MIIPIAYLKTNSIDRHNSESCHKNANSIITWVSVLWSYSFPFLVLCCLALTCCTALRNAICINTTLSKIMSRIEIFSLDRTPRDNGAEVGILLKMKKTSLASKGKDACIQALEVRSPSNASGECIEMKLTDIFHSINDFTIQLNLQHHSHFYLFILLSISTWAGCRPLRRECWVHSL